MKNFIIGVFLGIILGCAASDEYAKEQLRNVKTGTKSLFQDSKEERRIIGFGRWD